MPPVGGRADRRPKLKKKRVVKMVPHGPGGQMLRPAPKATQAPRSAAQKREGVKVVKRAAQATPKKKASSPHQVAVREAYADLPTSSKRKVLKYAKTHPTPEGDVALRTHARRLKQNDELAARRANAWDTMRAFGSLGAAVEKDRERERLHPDPPKKKGGPLRFVGRELEGKGLLAKGLGDVADLVEHRVAKGGMKLPGLVTHASTSGLDPKLVTRGVKDAIELPAQTLPSLYVPVAAAVEKLQGHPERANRLKRDIDASDPVFNAAAAGVAAVKGDQAEAERRIKAAGKAAADHPGFALAEIGGAKGLVGRGAGRVLRTGVAGKTAKSIASTTRAPIALEGTAIKVKREYSPDLITKSKQVLQEHHGTDKHRNPRVTAKDLNLRVDDRVAVSGLDPHHFVGEFAARSPEGKIRLFTPHQVDAAAAELKAKTGHDFVAQHADGTGERQVLIPKVAVDRLMEHAHSPKGRSTLGKGIATANSAFAQTVLSTSTSWAAGNVIEAGLRAGLTKSGPRSWITAHKSMKRLEEIDPDAAAELAQRVTGGGHYSLQDRTAVKNIAEQFAGTSVEPLANALHKVRQTPGPKQAADLWHVWTKSVFGGTKIVERQFQKAMLGSEIRRSNLMDGHLLKLSDKAIDQAAQGLRDTNEQVHFARAVERAYGKYNAMSPSMKHAMALYTPFAAWSLNAVQFITRTLPKDHPAAVGLTAAAENATEEWRKDHGLSLWMDGSVPGWLQGSIPGKGGKKYRVSRFTPFGAFGDLGGTMSGQVLPLASGPLLALKGLSWNGAKLDFPGGAEGDKQVHNALVSIGEFIDATIPVVAQAKRAHEKGAQAFNPFAPVAPPKKKIRKRKSTSTAVKWDDSSSSVKWDDGSGQTGFFPKAKQTGRFNLK